MELEFVRRKKISNKEKDVILKLLKNGFEISSLPEVDYHHLCFSFNKLIGYSAISLRTIKIDSKLQNANLLGLVVVDSTFQNNGIGSELIKSIIMSTSEDNDYGIILNCGKEVEEFYKRNGFFKICDRAQYLRNNKYEIDNDPIYYYGNKIECNVYKNIFLGKDF